MQLSKKLLLQEQIKFDGLLLTAFGTYSKKLPAGVYLVETVGGGGQGGAAGKSSFYGGGAGGSGYYSAATLKLTKPIELNIVVGAGGGKTSTNIASGGAGGDAGKGSPEDGGKGGNSGGYSSVIANAELTDNTVYLSTYMAWESENGDTLYVSTGTDLNGLTYIGGKTNFCQNPGSANNITVTTTERWLSVTYNNVTYTRLPAEDVFENGLAIASSGGAGGGGGGGQSTVNLSGAGAGGGGGGGYAVCSINQDKTNVLITLYPGKNGAKGADEGTSPQNGADGLDGNKNFLSIFSGAGGNSESPTVTEATGGKGATGGGASGGSGASLRTSGPFGRDAGSGGGGAGGDLRARGGKGGAGAKDAYNANVWPINVYDNNGNLINGNNNSNPTWGMGGAGGNSSGAAGKNGADGWVQITQIG